MDFQELLSRALNDSADLMDRVSATGWDAPSPCAGWTVRQTANHFVGGLEFLTRVVEGERPDFSSMRPEVDHLGRNPADAVRAAGKHVVTAFGVPGVLEQTFPLPIPDMPGRGIANICLLEAVVHGWDMAKGAGLAYQPDEDLVVAVRAYADTLTGERRNPKLFAPVVPTPPDADAFTATLGQLGRRA